MAHETFYVETVSSARTTAFFAALTVLFACLFAWRAALGQAGGWSIAFLILALNFLFYTLNFQTLRIRITPQRLELRFGLFTWSEALDNLAACSLDHLPALMRLGGAGVHFMFIRRRYRASFNFLEYPRVVVALKVKRGPAQDLSFTTRQPDQVLQFIAANRLPGQQPHSGGKDGKNGLA